MTPFTILCLLAGLLVIGPITAGAVDDQTQMVTGTVSDLDAAHLKLTVKTDLEKNVYVDVAQPDLLREVHAGDRVTLRLDAQGKADKITKLTVPELPSPPEAPAGRTP